MPHHRLLETVAAELRRQGISAAEVGRLVRELEDHLTDLSMEQGGRMDERMRLDEQIEARLGRSSELVAAALANRRQTSVFGRHPILSGEGDIPALIRRNGHPCTHTRKPVVQRSPIPDLNQIELVQSDAELHREKWSATPCLF